MEFQHWRKMDFDYNALCAQRATRVRRALGRIQGLGWSLGVAISQTTVARYVARLRHARRVQREIETAQREVEQERLGRA